MYFFPKNFELRAKFCEVQSKPGCFHKNEILLKKFRDLNSFVEGRNKQDTTELWSTREWILQGIRGVRSELTHSKSWTIGKLPMEHAMCNGVLRSRELTVTFKCSDLA
jgi:hypothetical protein